MKTRGAQWLLAMFVGAIVFFMSGCSKDEETENGGEEGGTTVETNTTATKEAKEAKVKPFYLGYWTLIPYPSENVLDSRYCWIYEDFKYKYSLTLEGNALCLATFSRESSFFTEVMSRGAGNHYSRIASLEGIGKVKELSSITERLQLKDGDCIISAEVQPYNGYIGVFRTQTDGDKHIRIYLKSYELDASSRLESVTIRYQLY